MVIHFRVDFEIGDNRANNLVVGAVSQVENLKFPLEDGELSILRCSWDKRSMIMAALHTVNHKKLSLTRYQVLQGRSNLGRNKVRRFQFSDLPI
jgi:hypothetical protein